MAGFSVHFCKYIWLIGTTVQNIHTYFTGFKELSVTLTDIDWKGMKGQSVSHVDIMLFLDWK